MNHILIIYLGSKGGGVLDSYEICEALCRVGGNSYYLIISANNPLRDRYKRLSLKNLFVLKTHKLSYKNFLFHTIFPLRILKILLTIKRVSPSAVFLTMDHPWLPIIQLLLKTFMPHTKTIYLKHNPNNFESKSSNLFNSVVNVISRNLVRSSNFVFTMSKYVKDEIVADFKIPAERVYSFNLGPYHSLCDGWKHTGFMRGGVLRLLFFGRILKYKGIDVLIDAYEMIKRENLPVHLTIAGEGHIDKSLLERINKLNIKLLNYWVGNNELCKLLSEADIIVLPYKRASQSGPASIALALCIPIISTMVGGLTEQVVDGVNGIVIKPNTPEDIVTAAKKVLDEPQLLNKFAHGAKYLMENHLSWDSIASKMDKVLSEILMKDR